MLAASKKLPSCKRLLGPAHYCSLNAGQTESHGYKFTDDERRQSTGSSNLRAAFILFVVSFYRGLNPPPGACLPAADHTPCRRGTAGRRSQWVSTGRRPPPRSGRRQSCLVEVKNTGAVILLICRVQLKVNQRLFGSTNIYTVTWCLFKSNATA